MEKLINDLFKNNIVKCNLSPKCYQWEITYLDKKMDETKRKISPIKAFIFNEETYLEAYCFLRNDFRTFMLRGILAVKKLQIVVVRYKTRNPEVSFSNWSDSNG